MKALKWCGILALTFSLHTLNAQGPAAGVYHPWEIGFRYMPTFSSFDVRTYNNDAVQTTLTLGHGWGGLIGYNFNEHVGLQGEVMYQSLAQKYRDRGMDRVVKLNYVNFPLLVSLNTDKSAPVNLNFSIGPQFGFNVGSKLESSDGKGESSADTLTAVLAVKAGDVGVAYGAGVEFGFGADQQWAFDLGFRGVYGLLDISDHSKTTTTDQYYILDRAHVKTYAGYAGFKYRF